MFSIDKLSKAISQLTDEISRLANAIENGLGCPKSDQPATKQDLEEMETRLMSSISDFAAHQSAFNTRLDTAITGLQADVEALNAKIEELQNSPGSITPEDQALLDELTSRGEAITAKLEALDALTPPPPPPPAG